MTDQGSSPRLPAIDPGKVEPRRGSGYPLQFQDTVEGRAKMVLGDALGLSHYGVNLVRLPPGSHSARRHWHSHEDEFVFVVEGELMLVDDGGEQVLGPGMAAGFPAGKENGHHLINRGNRDALYLEVGDRIEEDEVFYPDDDLALVRGPDGHHFVNRKGEPY